MLKEFVVSDVFGNAQHRKYHPPETLVPDDNGYPYICASNQNNGINKNLPYVNGTDIQLTPQKIIAWGKQCPMFCYHDRPCVCSQGMYFLDMTEYAEEISLYVCGALSAATHGKYNYSNCLTGEKMDREHVSLPAVESEDPGHVYTADDIDWNYMRSRVRELEQERVRELDAYLKAAGLNDYELTQEEKDILTLHRRGGGIKTRAFRLSSLFQVFHGKRLKREDRIPGNIPLLTAGEQNQGVACYIGNDAEIYNNAISIDMFGNCFYHDGIFAGDDNIYFFVNEGYTPKAKEYIAAAVSKTTKGVYSYSLQFRQPSADQLEVELPVSPSGQPDFAFMEKYITAMEKQTITGIVKYKDRVIEETKKVVSSAVAS